MMEDDERGTGRTTQQMKAAPQGAFYIWPVHGSIPYARDLAHKLGRDDLKIVTPTILENGAVNLRGISNLHVVIDHATWDFLSSRHDAGVHILPSITGREF